MVQKKYKIKAIKCCQNDKIFYLTVLPSTVLRETCYISRRETNPTDGFQRALSKERAKAIAKYMDTYAGCLPATLILSSQKNSKLVFNEETSELKFAIRKDSFMVLDGQHRLYGLLLAEKEYEIPVALFDGLSISDEVNLFIDINTNQKGVPTALLLDIKELTGKETSIEQKQRILFDKLNKDSVMAGLFLANKSRNGYIARNVFNNATKELLENGYFADKDVEVIYKGVKNYLEAGELVLNNSKNSKARLTTSNMFKALFSLFNDVIDKTFQQFGDLKVEHIEEVMRPISKANFDKIGTNNAELKALIADMKAQLNDYATKYRNYDEDDIF